MFKGKRIAEYVLEQEIGRGNYSTVYMAYKSGDKSKSQKYAIKCLKKSLIDNNSNFRQLLNCEASIMK